MIPAPTGDQKEQDTSSSLYYSSFSYEKFISSGMAGLVNRKRDTEV
jgi:hypothetical protein